MGVPLLLFWIFVGRDWLEAAVGDQVVSILVLTVVAFVCFVATCQMIPVSAIRFRRRLSLKGILLGTALVSLYLSTVSLYPPLPLTRVILGGIFSASIGWLLVKSFHRVFSNSFYFVETWDKPEGEREILVPPRLEWAPHLTIATVGVAALWAAHVLFGGAPAWILFLWPGVMCRGHVLAIERTPVFAYDNGVRMLAKFWPYDKGSLTIYLREGVYYLAPRDLEERIIHYSTPPTQFWPVVPPECIDEVAARLVRQPWPEGDTQSRRTAPAAGSSAPSE